MTARDAKHFPACLHLRQYPKSRHDITTSGSNFWIGKTQTNLTGTLWEEGVVDMLDVNSFGMK